MNYIDYLNSRTSQYDHERMQMKNKCNSWRYPTQLIIVAVLLTVVRGSAQLYDFGSIVSDNKLEPSNEVYAQVNLSSSFMYLGNAEHEIFVSLKLYARFMEALVQCS